MDNQQIERYKEAQPVKLEICAVQANIPVADNRNPFSVTYDGVYAIKAVQRLQQDGSFDIEGLEGYVLEMGETLADVRQGLRADKTDLAPTGKVTKVIYADSFLYRRRQSCLDSDEFLRLGCPTTISIQEKEEIKVSER